jgi:hypothetical protein
MTPDYVRRQKESLLYLLLAVDRMTQEGRIDKAMEICRSALPRMAEEDVPFLLGKIRHLKSLAPSYRDYRSPIMVRDGRFYGARGLPRPIHCPTAGSIFPPSSSAATR